MNKEKSDRIRTKLSKFGWRIHDGSQKVQVTEMGVYVCPVCKETSKLVQRQAPGFKNILSICQHGHTVRLPNLYMKNIKLAIASADMNPLLARMLLCAWTVIPRA